MKKNSAELSFEEALKRLEEIVGKLENGELPIDESLKLFEEGTSISALCSRKLDQAEQQIRKISSNSAGAVDDENPS